jgi:type IV pilus assembly protein PilY1
MFTGKPAKHLLRVACGAIAASLIALGSAIAAPLNIKDTPLFLNETPPPLNMLVLSRDHRLYYEAYNDASDLDGDGTIDTGYKPKKIDYYGYFESNRCYDYSGGKFVPVGVTGTYKTCVGHWSGDWLNYVTMTRIDALRKVLYGGLRYVDTGAQTVLQRSFVPQDAHSWGKEYESVARDGYDISQYTPYALPAVGTRHLFANTTVLGETNETLAANPAINGVPVPKLRVLLNRNNRIWNWLSIERPVANTQIVDGIDGNGSEIRSDISAQIQDYTVRVQVCGAGSYDTTNTNCKVYSTGFAKPTGLLQDYGENDSMFFGLLSGSYGRPHDGGVLRKEVASIKNEINLANGTFVYNQNPVGIISTIDRLRITGFGGNYEYSCGWITDSSDAAGNCSMWGNPTGEMMYESLRYFAGKAAPTGLFFNNHDSNGQEASIGLTNANWDSNTNPYRAGAFPSCSKPFDTVISDISVSYDSDTVPGSYFGGYAGDLTGLDAATLGQKIWNQEIGATGNYFIGQSGGTYDGAPTVKSVSSFGNIRGLAPEAPAKEGSYNAASVAYFGNQNDLNGANGVQRVQTFAVALASPLPKIDIPVNGGRITLVPFAKSVDGLGINRSQGAYQPTNQIVDFYVDTLTPTSGRFRVNYEDVEQGADHDMDAIAVYDYVVNPDNTVTITVTSEYAAGGIVQHMGYVISGTSSDGTYLEVRDTDTCGGCDPDYFLDTPNVAGPLPLVHSRTFSAGSATAASVLKDPLWYAAKWGGFTDSNNNGIPDLRNEWAANAPAANTNPDPDNYFLVTNALGLKAQLSQAFNDILDRAGSASSASVSSGSISDDTRIYQATFDARNWSGHLIAYPVGTGQNSTTEGVLGASVWDAATQMPAPNTRKILTILPPASATAAAGILPGSSNGVPFRWASIGTARQTELQPPPASDGQGQLRLDYLRGDRSNEQPGGTFRKRGVVLGDIVNSAPVFVGSPPWRYDDSLETVPYSGFVTANLNRLKVVYSGANDGMMHAFDATTGAELFAYVPHGVFRNLNKLADTTYSHQFYADGTPSVVDAFFSGAWHTMLVAGLNKGGQSVYALDVTNPTAISESTAASTVKWEFTDQWDSDLGYTYSRPAVVKLQNGTWAAVFGNGYNNTDTAGGADTHVSTTGNAVLYVVDIATGAQLAKIDTGVGMAQDPLASSRPNGLATPAVIDHNGDGRSDTAYAGDLFGNLWKFDLSDANPNNWKVAYQVSGVKQPLFVARNASNQRQPITERPQVGRGPSGKGWVILFGTGKFMESEDRNIASLRVQSFYGVFDADSGTSGDIVDRSNLLQQTILAEQLFTYTDPTGVSRTTPIRVTSNNSRGPSDKGWYIDLVSPLGFQGEMQVTNPVLRNGRAVFTTLIPDTDICAYGGRSWLMDMDALSGSRLAYTPFDLNRDLQYNSGDYVTVGGVQVSVSGRGSDSILTAPAFLSGNLSDYAVTTSSGSSSNDGTIDIARSNAGPAGRGRQSWRQLR